MRLFKPKVKISSPETLPSHTPFMLVCDTREIVRTALYLTAKLPGSLRFIFPTQKKESFLKSSFYKVLHIHQLHSVRKVSNPRAHLNSIWKVPRELITRNQTLVFFSNSDYAISSKADKSVAKLAFHTASVFDFSLSLQIIPVKVKLSNEGVFQINILQGVYISAYEKDYKQRPARTINEVTKLLQFLLSNTFETRENFNPILTEKPLS
ncbi:hypothetical protein [Catalinimonas locisalis]|uniref:hypothetical protein n=1 Tax=Catalinimonas locisalis TaxID=3133978 RepID=UPI003101711C